MGLSPSEDPTASASGFINLLWTRHDEPRLTVVLNRPFGSGCEKIGPWIYFSIRWIHLSSSQLLTDMNRRS